MEKGRVRVSMKTVYYIVLKKTISFKKNKHIMFKKDKEGRCFKFESHDNLLHCNKLINYNKKNLHHCIIAIIQ